MRKILDNSFRNDVDRSMEGVLRDLVRQPTYKQILKSELEKSGTRLSFNSFKKIYKLLGGKYYDSKK